MKMWERQQSDRKRAARAYRRFRIGLRFADVRAELDAEADAKYHRGEYMFISRSTVLGRMHQYKQEAWEAYQRELADRDGLPF